MNKKEICKENGYHNFVDEKEKLCGVEFQHDDFEGCSLIITCQDCGMSCEAQGDFED